MKTLQKIRQWWFTNVCAISIWSAECR